jgi:hypothetical protein
LGEKESKRAEGGKWESKGERNSVRERKRDNERESRIT